MFTNKKRLPRSVIEEFSECVEYVQNVIDFMVGHNVVKQIGGRYLYNNNGDFEKFRNSVMKMQ